MIKFNIAKNLNIDVKQLQLSANYISLFDRLEKANHTYNNIIEMKNASIKKVIETEITKLCVSEGGYFEWFEAIVNKYGLIPEQYMPDAKESILPRPQRRPLSPALPPRRQAPSLLQT